ncbi:actin-like protein 3b, putative [Anopheles sinensis]|uniref:Actin-like protein 3b, putative n=1 Tax=Anopheles sinensis TaxID=74873 RepID=A0A084VR52_ANOSI|nr:actin-like protein 3b, putative [Anopheles sinensis]
MANPWEGRDGKEKRHRQGQISERRVSLAACITLMKRDRLIKTVGIAKAPINAEKGPSIADRRAKARKRRADDDGRRSDRKMM